MDRKEYLLRQLTAKREEYQHLRDSAFYRTDSTLLIASATVLAIVAAFDSTAVCPTFRMAVVALGGVSILSLSVALISYAHDLQHACRKVDETIQALFRAPESGVPPGVVLEFANNKVCQVSKAVGYVSFVLFIIGLTMTAISK